MYIVSVLNSINMNRLLRTNVLSLACSQGINDCVNNAKSYYLQWMSQERYNP